MEKVPLNNVGHDFSFDRDIGIITAVLESGNSVELPATGYSMFPILRPGDKVIVKPLTKGELPLPGNIVVYLQNNGLVMHRLVEIINGNSNEPVFITRGDSMTVRDEPLHQHQLIGIAYSYRHSKTEHFVKTFIPGARRYEYNRRLLWIFNKIHRLDHLLRSLINLVRSR